MPEHRRDHVLDDRSLLRLVHPEEVARVVDAMGEEFPAGRAARLDDLRVVLAERDVERDAAPDAVGAEDVEDPPDADAVAVVSVRVGRDVRLPPRPRAPGRVVRGQQLVELDVRRHPDRDPRVTGPGRASAGRRSANTRRAGGRRAARLVVTRARADISGAVPAKALAGAVAPNPDLRSGAGRRGPLAARTPPRSSPAGPRRCQLPIGRSARVRS